MSESLHPLERRIIDALREKGEMPFDELVARSRLNPDQVRRALQWLSTKGIVRLVEKVLPEMSVTRLPPELTLMEKVVTLKEPTIESLKAQFASSEEFSAAFGRARAGGWINVDGGRVKSLDSDKPAALKSAIESIKGGAEENALNPEQKEILSDLLKRGIVTRSERTTTSVGLTDSGKVAVPSVADSQTIDQLTPEILAARSWQGKKLRPIDVEAKAPVFFPGRRHPVRDFIREVRETYVSMGFEELQGDSIHPAFWNFDALFIPQDHPGREMQDTFYLEGLTDRRLSRTGVVANVAATHQDGWKTGSRGWGYKWRIEEARRLVLRTHNTVLTVRALSSSKEKEARVFAVSKVYRNENLDYKHLAEFHQMDGIIVGKGLNVRHLMGFLQEFYKKLGMKDVKLWPTYFPYTEPSLEVLGYSEAAKSWIELSGSGVFRPEVTLPLGVKVPVLAWGPGIERLMLLRFGLDDMRDLYGNNLSWLRNRIELVGGPA